jgi:hypothetical protein
VPPQTVVIPAKAEILEPWFVLPDGKIPAFARMTRQFGKTVGDVTRTV